VFIEVAIDRTSQDAFDAFRDAVLAIPQVQECHMVAGGFDYLLKVRVRDMAAYRAFLSDALANVPGIRSTHTYPVMESVKEVARTVARPSAQPCVAANYSIAAVDFALSRSRNFWILPVEVFGKSPNTTFFGALKRASSDWQCAMSSAFGGAHAGLELDERAGRLAPLGIGLRATTAAATTAGCRYSASSTSSELMFSPPEMITSLLRSLILT
jgi:hypothetical protein